MSKLLQWFTHTDRDIFGLKLPQEVAGALFSRYSRSKLGIREIFVKEFLPHYTQDIFHPSETLDFSLERARRFYDRVLSGYGDDSIAQLGGAHIACENISGVAAMFLTDFRIGIGLLEKSSRYVEFSSRNTQGQYRYYTPVPLAYNEKYRESMNMLFDVYSHSIAPTIDTLKQLYPLASIVIRHPETGEERQGNEWEGEWVAAAYTAAIRSHALDILRSYLPISTLTNVGVFAVGQEWGNILTNGYGHSLDEVRNLVTQMHDALNQLIPSFVRRSAPSAYRIRTSTALRSFLASLHLKKEVVQPSESVQLVEYSLQNEASVLRAILYSFGIPLENLSISEDKDLLRRYVGDRLTRRDKPGRALEHAEYTFDFFANLGIYRDLKRHRLVTIERQPIGDYGTFDIPEEIAEGTLGTGVFEQYQRIMYRMQCLYRDLVRDFGEDIAQYCVPMAFKQRWRMKMNLREALHICELRSTPQGHPSYRRLVQKMWAEIIRVDRLFATFPTFVDFNTYKLGRLTSEVKHAQR